MSLFDAATVNLQGLNLIEASAGTGKTFTLAELYCRLITEKQLEVNQILVVTYTRAATEELRSRLRKRLVDERQKLSKQGSSNLTALKRLKLAIQSFDEAAIFTIHGFCQRALQDFAFESGHFFDMEMVTDEQEIKQAVVDDFWRRHVSTADADFARYLLNQKQTPDTLLKAVGNLPGKPYLTYLPLPEVDPQKMQLQAETDFNSLKQCWRDYNAEVIDIVTDNDLLKPRNYRSDWVKNWLIMLEALMQEPDLPDQVFEQIDRFTRERLEPALQKGKALPDHPFWAHAERFINSHQQLKAGREIQLQQLRMQLAGYLREELARRKLQLKLQAFDDLLLNLQQALHSKQGGKLAAQIRQQFQAALIDEFQDTDPIQYDCFNTIFAGSGQPVFFVGDPKQAIYSFRGADIFTYLNAKQASEREFNLDTNWRSHPLLVDAVNTLFERVEKPFIYDDIPFYPVKSARDNTPALTVSGKAGAPLEFIWLDGEQDVINKGEMEGLSASMTAGQIAGLIQQSNQGEVLLTDKEGNSRALNGGDIAVLVRSHSQAASIQQALRHRGINSVQQSRDNVFQSEQAVMLERVLMAVANPGNDRLIATALATPIFAKTALQIYELQQDDNLWLAQSDFFMSLHESWRTSGFIVMLRSLLVKLDVQRRLLQQPDGERQLTNLMHLAELVQAYASRRNSTMEAVLTWFASQRQSSAAAQDAAQIRLESDEQLVKVITIHTSKGLEYPVVFCPFLWHQGKPKQKPAVMVFHRGEHNEACAAFGEPGFAEAGPIAAEEEKAEDLRLLYVALTRARERCIILWGAAKESQKTAMFNLLHGDLDKPDVARMHADLAALAADYPANIALLKGESDFGTVVDSVSTATALMPRQFKGTIAYPWQVGSFSSLTRGHTIEQPDYDADTVVADWQPSAETRQDRFGFPRGSNAGTCLHSLFENWDFQTTGHEWQQLVTKTLNQYGIDSSWSPVVSDWLQSVVKTPLAEGSTLTLDGIAREKRLDEMAFYFPVSQLTVKRLKQTLLPFTETLPILDKVMQQLNFSDITGFMKGFIDLVFEFEGRFYIADYKSNWLGDKKQDYAQRALDEAMVMHGYPLQYLIYSLALHRYLKTRLPEYEPELHFGGVYYLFIRGMQPEWGQAGVYYDRPSTELLNALDNCMQEADHD
ncbi:exodeoxyribonuclease V subunit beta [Methylophaga sp. OBS4]|uniref:exodeoxyribonuclease V subunit beta n=1 Tax=Methylophaga sp. OBS4 TaxID=2991935 RepID=UPI00224F959F|nr:exodeoxyribonuclease V subunit beta [Methylophaga sp. OBS4]MCX4186661.1 exodeoxyribonuclease V subunit beta [Methylophaga sp. OBS4]